MQIIAEKYEVVRELGGGSYGKVYLVRHVDLGLQYALKLLNRSFSEEARFIERFKREADILQRFAHPGSVQLRDFGRTKDGLYYMTTDYSEGQVLSAVIEQEGWFPVLLALDVTIQILSVLDAAHKLGIIHRDIKSANLMLETASGGKRIVRVLDFGIAKLREEIVAPGTGTGEGFAIGTPEYMSPEQAAGSPVVSQSDLYSVGVVLYEMMTGDVPFRGHTVVQTLLKHLTQPPPPFAERLVIPPYLEQIVFKALAKEPAERFQSASEFQEACEDALRKLQRDHGVVVESGEPAPLPAPVPEERPPAKRPRLLCLDDTEMILQVCSHLFEAQGYEVFTASSFAAIHDYIFLDDVNLMLCDVQMPGLPGPKICSMIKKVRPDFKVILFSNIDERELERLAKESKADAWVSKNKKPTEWIAMVNEVAARGTEVEKS